jgi:phage FluMu protein Com
MSYKGCCLAHGPHYDEKCPHCHSLEEQMQKAKAKVLGELKSSSPFEQRARELTNRIEAYAWADDFRFAQQTVPLLAKALQRARIEALVDAERAVGAAWHGADGLNDLLDAIASLKNGDTKP